MNLQTKRRLIRFLAVAEPITDILGLAAITLFFIHYLPEHPLARGPATGGDMGSHFWPLYTLVNWGIPSHTLRIWNPGNLGGEPHLVHYFPLPFYLMAIFSRWMPLGAAFNLGTLVPIFLMPFASYGAFRGIGLRFPAPLLAAAGTICFLYNESYSMFGGNILSTLAGQFAHTLSISLYLLAVGALCWEIRKGRPPFLSMFLLAGVALSHALLELVAPFALLSIALCLPWKTFRYRLYFTIGSGLGSILLSLWFLVAMVTNQRWTTAVPMSWKSDPQLLSQLFPAMMFPVFALFLTLLPSVFLLRGAKQFSAGCFRSLGIWLIPSAACIGYFFIFTPLGLVDIRAVPQIQLFVALATAQLLSLALIALGRVFAWLIAPQIVIASIFWVGANVQKLPQWLEWNYSGWAAKPLHQEHATLMSHLRGNFSDPRVVYEHNSANEATGTMRVFEMLPYFANRATLESLYLQASILSSEAFHIQAEVSKTPSCPIHGTYCPKPDLISAEPRLRLMGVGELILATKDLTLQADATPYLERETQVGHWSLYRLRNQPSLVEVLFEPPVLVDPKDPFAGLDAADRQALQERVSEMSAPGWLKRFYLWFRRYTGRERFLVINDEQATKNHAALEKLPVVETVASNSCQPTVTVGLNSLHLLTPCPGKFHVLKFAYHSSWYSDSGDPLLLTSPGFLGIIPSRGDVTLTFGDDPIWHLADRISLIFFAMVVVGILISLFKRKGTLALLIPFSIFFLSSPCEASFIRLEGRSQLNFSVSGETVRILGNYTIKNEGDEPAQKVFPHLSLGGWSWSGEEKLLQSNETVSWEIDTTIPIRFLECEKNWACAHLALPTFGVHPLLIRRHYQDANGRRFTAADVAPVMIGVPEGGLAQLARVPRVSGRLLFSRNEEDFIGSLTVQNFTSEKRTLALSYFAPQELLVTDEPRTLEISSSHDASLQLTVKNGAGLPGSRYGTFAVLQWEQSGIRMTAVITGHIDIIQRDGGLSEFLLPVAVSIGVFLFSCMLLHLLVIRVPKRT